MWWWWKAISTHLYWWPDSKTKRNVYTEYSILDRKTLTLERLVITGCAAVLTATTLSYGRRRNSTHHRIKTPSSIDMNFEYVITSGRYAPISNFAKHRFSKGFWGDEWNIIGLSPGLFRYWPFHYHAPGLCAAYPAAGHYVFTCPSRCLSRANMDSPADRRVHSRSKRSLAL